jgi:hypothetical protein
MLGYFFVFWRAASSSLSAGPGYRTVRLGGREPCEGGLKRVGFSRTGTLEGAADDLGADALDFAPLVDAARAVRGMDEERRGRHEGAPRGRRKRGIEADIAFDIFLFGRPRWGILNPEAQA